MQPGARKQPPARFWILVHLPLIFGGTDRGSPAKAEAENLHVHFQSIFVRIFGHGH